MKVLEKKQPLKTFLEKEDPIKFWVEGEVHLVMYDDVVFIKQGENLISLDEINLINPVTNSFTSQINNLQVEGYCTIGNINFVFIEEIEKRDLFRRVVDKLMDYEFLFEINNTEYLERGTNFAKAFIFLYGEDIISKEKRYIYTWIHNREYFIVDDDGKALMELFKEIGQ